MNEDILHVIVNCKFMYELLAACAVFMLPLNKRRHFAARILLGSVLCIFLASLQPLDSGLLLIVTKYLPQLALAALVIWFCCNLSIPDVAYCALCSYSTQHFAYSLHTMCQLIFPVEAGYLPEFFFSYILCYTGTYLLFFLLFARRLPEQGRYQVNVRQTTFSAVLIIPFALVLSLIARQWFYEDGGRIYYICQLYAMLCCFFALWIQVNQQKLSRRQEELLFQRQLRYKQKEQYAFTQENISLINRKCHDLKHQVAALRTVQGEQEREAHLREMERAVMIYDSIVKSGNDVLDTVLTEKSLLCEQAHITLTCVADGRRLDFMDAVDIYTIFGNALDNAIESVLAVSDTERRIISVAVYMQSNLVLLQIENYYENPLRFENGLPITTKEPDGTHGFGLKSIQYTTEKYGGVMTIHADDGLFILRVSIPSGQPPQA